MLAGIVHKIIYQIILFGWLMIVNGKIREPFQSGNWFIEESTTAAFKPATIYKVRNITQSLMLREAYVFSEIAVGKLRKSMPGSVKLIPISQAIKACVMKDQECHFFYCGNYSTSKLLLSRLRWTDANSRRFTFFDFSLKSVYQAVMETKDEKNSALVRWSRILARPNDHQWSAMFQYLHDPIINSRCKEVLYKIHTHVLPVGTSIEKSGKPTNCCFCDDEEDEFHLFIHCPRIEGVWAWLS
jgi:hypothetical protein